MVIYNRSDFGDSKGVGGATGSGRAEHKERWFGQLKSSIRSAPWIRRAKAGTLDVENLGEFIAARMAKKLVVTAKEYLVPEVSFVIDENNKVGVISKYLPNFQELLHEKDIQLTSDTKQQGQKHYIAPERRKELCDMLALSIALKDHDINPQNLGYTGSDSDFLTIGRIDFGHAFNESLSLPDFFGGGLRNKDNQVLDYFNREALPSDTGPKPSKLWRSYEELVPSKEMAEALKEMSEKSKNNNIEAVSFAKEGFQELIKFLDARKLQAQKKLEHYQTQERAALTSGKAHWAREREKAANDIAAIEAEKKFQIESLIGISNNLGGPKIKIDKDNYLTAIDQAFRTIQDSSLQQARDMQVVSRLMEIQLELDRKIEKREKITQDEVDKYTAELDIKGSGIGHGNRKINWIKSSKDKEAITGTVKEYIRRTAKERNISEKDIKASLLPKPSSIMARIKESIIQTYKDIFQNGNEKTTREVIVERPSDLVIPVNTTDRTVEDIARAENEGMAIKIQRAFRKHRPPKVANNASNLTSPRGRSNTI